MPSSAKVAVSSVPGMGLVSASPWTSDVTVHDPTGEAARNRSAGAPSASSTSSSSSTRHPLTRPSAARYARSTSSAGGGHAFMVVAPGAIVSRPPSRA